MKFLTSPLLLLLSSMATLFGAELKLELAVPFTDNMILQRESAVPVWGFDQPGSQITVSFAGQTHKAVADEKGDWMLKLDPLEVSREERGFQVKNNRGEVIDLTGVLVGEVWFSSGQSNMV
ncbi:MAG: sialate O-acetylesterase [Akkermansiaceae bacterium]|jgi:sialate O-acetylesterase